MFKKYITRLAIILIPAVFVYSVYTLTTVRKVEITGDELCTTEAQVNEKIHLENTNMIILSKIKVEEEIRQNFPCVSKITVQKNLPSTLILDITSETAIVEVADTPYSLTAAGFTTTNNSGRNLPKLFLPSQIVLTENKNIEDKNVLFALALVKDLLKSDFTPTQIRFVDNVDIIIYSQTEAKALFTTTKDQKIQVDSLQAVLAKAKMNSSKISQIDLRFNKPVMTYKE